MATPKQVEANRRNAKRSTGPKSSQGKAASSRNAIKHGVLSESVVADTEDEEKFRALLDQLIADHEPATAMECALVERLAILLWRERRLARAEKLSLDSLGDNVFSYLEDALKRGIDPKGRYMGFSTQLLIGRYQTMLTNQISQTLKQLREEQEFRLNTLEG